MSEEINNNDTQSAAVTLSRNIGPVEEAEQEQQIINICCHVSLFPVCIHFDNFPDEPYNIISMNVLNH